MVGYETLCIGKEDMGAVETEAVGWWLNTESVFRKRVDRCRVFTDDWHFESAS